MRFGPTIWAEIRAAGVSNLVAISADGYVTVDETATEAERKVIAQVVADHDPTAVEAPASPTAAEAAARAALDALVSAEILARLGEIDLASLRPLRAIAAGSAVDKDRTRLQALDTEAAALRTELAASPGPTT